ncbi:hypothetical protein PRVXT_002816 [Proteinivorax tanatarense]|uniref:Uncharacterized protein n=1 Tax=Proteinivorax tanatarense TaxID=1260629 RepID=A0AAU7VLU4_9FIRM
MNIFTEIAQFMYQITGVNVALYLSTGFFLGVLVIFTATMLMVIFNLLATKV